MKLALVFALLLTGFWGLITWGFTSQVGFWKAALASLVLIVVSCLIVLAIAWGIDWAVS